MMATGRNRRPTERRAERCLCPESRRCWAKSVRGQAETAVEAMARHHDPAHRVEAFKLGAVLSLRQTVQPVSWRRVRAVAKIDITDPFLTAELGGVNGSGPGYLSYSACPTETRFSGVDRPSAATVRFDCFSNAVAGYLPCSRSYTGVSPLSSVDCGCLCACRTEICILPTINSVHDVSVDQQPEPPITLRNGNG